MKTTTRNHHDLEALARACRLDIGTVKAWLRERPQDERKREILEHGISELEYVRGRAHG